MAIATAPDPTVLRILKVLGIDLNETRSVKLIIEHDDAVRVEVVRYITQKELGKISEILELEKYELRKIE